MARQSLLACLVLWLAVACQQRNPPALPDFRLATPADIELVQRQRLPERDNDLAFTHLTLEDGLSQSSIYALQQDAQGFIWIGTANGLNRYDGYGFTTFWHDPRDPSSLASNVVTALTLDARGSLWVGTIDGLDRFDPTSETFEHFRHDRDDPASLRDSNIGGLHADRTGRLWVGTISGLDRLDPVTGAITSYPHDLDPEGEPPADEMLLDAAGTLWVATPRGLFSMDPDTGRYTRHTLLEGMESGPYITTLFEDAAGTLWISSDNGLFTREPAEGRITHYTHDPDDPTSLASNVVYSVLGDVAGTVWLGVAGGLDRYVPARDRFYHYPPIPNQPGAISSDLVTTLYIDQAGVLWAGTSTAGLNRVDPNARKFGLVQVDPDKPENSLSSNLTFAFYEDEDGVVWIGTEEGLDRWDRAVNVFTHIPLDLNASSVLPGIDVEAIIPGNEGDLWIGTSGGLAHLDGSGKVLALYTADSPDPGRLSSASVSKLHVDEAGTVWVSTYGGGVNRLDPATGEITVFQVEEPEAGYFATPANIVADLLANDDGTFWLATYDGLGHLDPTTGQISFFPPDPDRPDSHSGTWIIALHKDNAGSLWLGTDNGLARFQSETQTYVVYREEDGLPNNTIYAIEEDENGRLWLSTNRGLVRFQPETGTFRAYDSADGLQGLEFNPGASFRSPQGEMFFGGINGFNTFFPNEIRDNPHVPPIAITDFLVLNQSVPFGPDEQLKGPPVSVRRIDLLRGDTVIAFELAALHFTDPVENQFAYFMQGFDDDWNFIGNRRYATYTNLPPGRYTFYAIASNSDGIWNTEPRVVDVIMPYPFWQRSWFIGLVLLLGVGLVVGGYQLRLNRSEAQAAALAAEVAARTAEIEQRRLIAEGLREILLIINSNRSLAESLHYIVSQAAQLTDAEDAIIFRFDEASQMVIVATNPGGQIQYDTGEALLAVTRQWSAGSLHQRRPLIVPSLEAHPAMRPDLLGSHRALLGVPLFLGDEAYGGLLMFYARNRSFSEEDLELGATFVDQAALAIANDRLRQRAEETAVASERNRLARDLHDAVSQTLFSASLIAEALPSLWEMDQTEGRQLLQELRALTRGALAEMRTLLLELRPAALEETSLRDLLQQLAESASGRTGIPITVDVRDGQQLPTNAHVALYRIAQESINNIVKHARASEAHIALAPTPEGNGLSLTVADNGRGFDPGSVSGDHLGLNIIRERAQSIGATLAIDSRSGQGTRITATWRKSDHD